MQDTITLARPYAQAVFKIAQQDEQLDLWSDMLQLLAAIARDDTMSAIVGNPRVGREQVAALFIDVGGGRLNDKAQNFIRVLADNDRLALFPEIADLFAEHRADVTGQADVEVIGAFEVNPKFRQMIATAMQNKLGREVKLSTSIDKSLIGGIVVRAGDLVIDASIRGRLKQLETELK